MYSIHFPKKKPKRTNASTRPTPRAYDKYTYNISGIEKAGHNLYHGRATVVGEKLGTYIQGDLFYINARR